MTQLVSTQYLADTLEDAHARTLELIEGLDTKQLMGPKLSIVNPLLWEIGHVAWFYEQFILRMLYKKKPILETGDDLYDSINIEHFSRWDLPLLTLDKVKEYIDEMSIQFDKSESVIVTHYQGLTVSQLDDLRKKMREHGIKFKITNNRITKLFKRSKLFTMQRYVRRWRDFV